MQTQLNTANNPQLPPPVKIAKKRGRKPLPFVAKPTPSSRVLAALTESRFLNFDALQAKTKLSDEKLGLALSTLIINTREVSCFTRNETRYYRLQPKAA